MNHLSLMYVKKPVVTSQVFNWKCILLYISGCSQSNPIELQLLDWLELGSVITHYWTHPKLLPIDHNRALGSQTLLQSNVCEHLEMEALIHQQVSSRFKQGVVVNKCVVLKNIHTPSPPTTEGTFVWDPQPPGIFIPGSACHTRPTPGISVFFQFGWVPPGKNISPQKCCTILLCKR